MANKTFTLIPISPEVILHNMKMAGYSIRRLGKETSYSERSIRSYLQREEMPEKLLYEIDRILRPKKHAIRITFDATITISDDRLKDLIFRSQYPFGFEDAELDELAIEDLWYDKGEVQFHKARIDKRELEPYGDWFSKVSKRSEMK